MAAGAPVMLSCFQIDFDRLFSGDFGRWHCFLYQAFSVRQRFLRSPRPVPLERRSVPVARLRRRMDRRSEKRLETLKKWRKRRSSELDLDPGVLCPNASLEAIASKPPKSQADLEKLPELKPWFANAFADEIVEIMQPEGSADDE